MRPSRKLHQFLFLLWHSLDVWKYYISYTDPNLLLRGLLKTMHRCPVLHEQPLPTLGIPTAGKSLPFSALCAYNMLFQRKRSGPQNLRLVFHHLLSPTVCRTARVCSASAEVRSLREMEKAVQGVEDDPLTGLTEKHEHLLLPLISWRLFPRKSLLHWANLRGERCMTSICLELVWIVDYTEE